MWLTQKQENKEKEMKNTIHKLRLGKRDSIMVTRVLTFITAFGNPVYFRWNEQVLQFLKLQKFS